MPLTTLLPLVAVALLQTPAQPPAQTPAQPAAPPTAAPSAPAQAAPRPAGEIEKVQLTAGRSTVLNTAFEITRIAVTNPAVADAVVVQPREILIDGKAHGTVSLIVWGRTDRKQYDLIVEPTVHNLEQQLQALFPAEDISVNVTDEAIILSGRVSSNQIMLRAGEIAAASSAKAKVINMLQLPGGSDSQQVMLQVRFAEVNRRALQELGVSMFALRERFAARSATQQFAAPEFDNEDANKVTFSDFLNIFFFDFKEGFGAVLKALEQSGGFQSLAEPNLIAYNDQEASFLAGGEFPVPVVQGGNTNAVTIQFKEFGVRLTFKPTIAGDVIRLKVSPEVSALDFANGLSLGGFRVPALTTRRASTDVELRDGQSFAIAGLLQNLSQDDKAAIPIMSKLPIIGPLFKSRADRKERSELMVLITPRLVRALDPDEVPPLPVDHKRFLPRGEGIGEQLSGGGGAVDAPAAKPTPPKRGSN